MILKFYKRAPINVVLFIGILLTAATSATACSSLQHRSDPPLPLAFVAEEPYATGAQAIGQFDLVENGSVVARVRGNFTNRIADRRPVWTSDGRYATVLGMQNGHTQIVAIDRKTKKVRLVPCVACTAMVAVGGARILAMTEPISAAADGDIDADLNPDPNQLIIRQVDLASSLPPVELSAKGNFKDLSVSFLSGVPNAALVAISSQFGTWPRLALLSYDGKITPLGKSQSQQLLGPATATPGRAGQGRTVAINGGWPKSVPESPEGHAFLLNLNDGKHTYIDFSSIVSPAEVPRSDVQIDIFDLWWGPDGNLYSTIGLYKGNPRAGNNFKWTISPRVWRLRSGKWEQESTREVIAFRRLSRHETAFIVPSDPSTPAGTLYIEKSGKPSRIARSVDGISTPPSAPGG